MEYVKLKDITTKITKGTTPSNIGASFTDEGIIKSYEIDYNSVEHNPMGGFTVTTYMNNDKELYMRFLFDKYGGYLDIGGGSISGKLSDMLEGQ